MLIVQQKNVQHLEVRKRERSTWCDVCARFKNKSERWKNDKYSTLTWSLMHTVMCCVFVASEGEIKNNILMLLWKY